MLVRDLAALLNARYEGNPDLDIVAAASVESAAANQISFVAGKKAVQLAAASRAGCLLVGEGFPEPAGRTVIRVKDPRTAFARVIARLHPPRKPEPGIHPTAIVAADARIGERISLGPRVVIGEGSKIGAGTSIGAGSVIGRNVTLGDDCLLHANVTIYDEVSIGHRAVLHSGCVLGADGFGFVMVDGGYRKFPQIGRVEIGDDVEIGANSCIDRAALGVTRIGNGVKIDNMVHVGHNCSIGNHVVIAAQTGFSGGVVVEDYAVIGGQVGIGDKARIESRAVLGSGCGVLTSKIVRGGQTVWGTPARPLKQYLETLAAMSKLPEYRHRLIEIERRLDELVQRRPE